MGGRGERTTRRAGGQGEPVPREALEEAYREVVRTATRSSLMGAMGFGLALIMGARLSTGQALFGGEPWLERFFLVGGIFGGGLFTLLALRASRTARALQRRLKEQVPPDDR